MTGNKLHCCDDCESKIGISNANDRLVVGEDGKFPLCKKVIQTELDDEACHKEEDIVTPPRYTKGTIEVWDAIIGMDLSYLEGNAVKYIARHEQKGGVEDLKKAIQYIKKIAKTVYKEDI